MNNILSKLLQGLGFTRSALSSLPFQPAAGQLVSVVPEDGGFAVMKLLVVDRGGVHVRLYAQRFPWRAREVDLGELSLASFEGNPFSIGHIALRYQTFLAWEPRLICARTVDESELDGYRIWEEARGGYF